MEQVELAFTTPLVTQEAHRVVGEAVEKQTDQPHLMQVEVEQTEPST
jgi:hypothetical protein